MEILDKIKQIIVTKKYLGKTDMSPLKGKLTQKLIDGWKGNTVAKNVLKVVKFDISQAKKGNVNKNIRTNIELVKKIGLKKFTYLDVGCSVGGYVGLFKILAPELDIDYTGIDYSKELIDKAKRIYGKIAKFEVADMQNIPFKDKSFDVVCSSSVLPYSPDYSRAVSELSRVARKYVLITRLTVTTDKEIFQKQKAYGSEWSSILFNEKRLKEIMKKNNLKILTEIIIKKVDAERDEKSYLLKVVK